MIIEQHEAALKAMMIPEPVWMVYASECCEESPEGPAYLIGMDKWQGSWRLCHAIEYYCGPCERQDVKPLDDASILDRRRAILKIEALREKIIEAKEKLIPILEKALEAGAKSLENYPKRNRK